MSPHLATFPFRPQRRRLDPVEIPAGRLERLTWVQTDGLSPVALVETGDVLVFGIATTEGGAPLLTVRSDSTTTNGSTIEVDADGFGQAGASGTLVLAPGDTAGLTGRLHFGWTLLDESEGGAPVELGRGELYVMPNV
jgi:hypothetical protein